MEQIKEANKNLINLRSSIITVMIELTSGIFSLLFIEFPVIKSVVLFVIGLHFDALFLHNVICINKQIENNIRRLTNDSK